LLTRLLLAAAFLVVGSAAGAAAAQGAALTDQTGATAADDPFLWLEDVHGARAMDWVKAENAKTLGVLESDPRFAGLYADALKIAQAEDRIPTPEFIAGRVYNFWQDTDHVRGLWRETSVEDYARAAPPWTPVLDLDALSAAEHANWVWKGSDCRWPAERRCLISLSDGGEDAVVIREFDLAARSFVGGGFDLPRGKQRETWEDDDTLLVAREWAPGEMTASGYPFVVKRLRRREPLSAAVEVFRGSASDGGYGVSPFTLHDGAGHQMVLIARPLTTFEREYYLVTPRGAARLDLPLKSQPQDMVAGRLLVSLEEDWTVGDARFPAGALVSIDAAQAQTDPGHLKPTLVYAPGPRESIDAVASTRSRLVVTAYDNVRGRAFVFTPTGEDGWTRRRLALPDDVSIDLESTNQRDEHAFLAVTGFLTPPTLWLADADFGEPASVKSMPAKFDASKDVVEQREATSTDGTKVPYFIVRPRDMALNGANPTLLYAYGGFQVSETPTYSAILGKLWLERGGVFVLANIRGGGEFGPAWHEAGLKTHRQRVFDDFAAVARDLIATHVTGPRRLGIQGGSNGGLLMGVEFTQHPDLWRAVDIQVPLLDMLRFEKIAAGASWIGEYGSVSNPDERAFLASISPYNNVKPGVSYPRPLIWTTTKDDRVGPQHARKFAARLSAMGIPYYFYEVVEGGHGAGANLKEKAHTSAVEMTYFIRQLMD
jgi:prolyl oligopeptidase